MLRVVVRQFGFDRSLGQTDFACLGGRVLDECNQRIISTWPDQPINEAADSLKTPRVGQGRGGSRIDDDLDP